MIRSAFIAVFAALALTGATIAQDAPAAPTDPQIAHIAYTAGQIDIAAAEQALQKSQNPDVIAFAELMARDHKAVNDQALALLDKLGVTPEDNPTSQKLSADAAAKLQELGALDGAAFDAAYVANEVSFHQVVNAALADVLIPAAQNEELEALLQTGLTLFSEHQVHAEHLAMDVK
jgi:putative membrane protein